MREELKSLRKAAGYSQRQLAEILDVTHSVIAKIESGERRIDVVEFCWLVTAYGHDPATVLARLQSHMGTPTVLKRRKK